MTSEHIDNDLLHSDGRYRFEYLSKFLNFTSKDIETLNRWAPIVSPQIPVIVDKVYRKLFSFDLTKNKFLVNEKKIDNGNVDAYFQTRQMSFRRDMLSFYLKRIFNETQWNENFLQYLSHVGQIHAARSELSNSANIDYIHINLLLGYLQNLLIETLWTSENIDETQRSEIINALNKVFWIQNDFFMRHFLPKPEIVSNVEKPSAKFSCLRCPWT